MELNQRQKDILALAKQNGKVTTTFLADKLFFSEMTIRRDLKKMDDAGYLKRYHGGAMDIHGISNCPIEERVNIHKKEKENLAKRALKHLGDYQTIFLPGSSSNSYILPYLKDYKGIYVVTNSIEFLITLSQMNIRCTVCGGEYYSPDRILLGHAAENFLRSMNYDIAFLGCDGIDEKGNVSVINEDAAEIDRIGFRNSKKCIIIADYSKFGVKCTYNTCNTAEVYDVIVQ